MEEVTQELNLFQKIADVKANIDGFTKDAKSYNYSYVSGSQVLHRIRNKMIENNLLLIPKQLKKIINKYKLPASIKKLNVKLQLQNL